MHQRRTRINAERARPNVHRGRTRIKAGLVSTPDAHQARTCKAGRASTPNAQGRTCIKAVSAPDAHHPSFSISLRPNPIHPEPFHQGRTQSIQAFASRPNEHQRRTCKAEHASRLNAHQGQTCIKANRGTSGAISSRPNPVHPSFASRPNVYQSPPVLRIMNKCNGDKGV